MDLDLAQVRAFVEVAEQLHFGRAGAHLFLTQQALSKRIQRLERALGEQLFVRGRQGVWLTEAGSRFLPHARQLLALADSASTAIKAKTRPLRVDVWGHLQRPAQVIGDMADRDADIMVELSMRRNLAAATEALQRGEIDAAFGRVHDIGKPWPVDLLHRPVLMERSILAVASVHRFAGLTEVTPSDLRTTGLWYPDLPSAKELMAYVRRFTGAFAIPLNTAGPNLGLDHVIDTIRHDPQRIALLGLDWPVPAGSGVTLVPLRPTPCFMWSIVWRRNDLYEPLQSLLRILRTRGRLEDWLTFDASTDWLPEPDADHLRRLHGARAQS